MMYQILIGTLLITSGIKATLPENNTHTNQPPLTRCQDGPTKCQNCDKDDPMEETLNLVLAAIPDVFAKFIQIVQNPDNKDTLIQSLSAIFAHIITIASSAFKRGELEQALRSIILSQDVMVRALALP